MADGDFVDWYFNLGSSHRIELGYKVGHAINGDIKVAATGALGSVGKTLNAKNTFYGKK